MNLPYRILAKVPFLLGSILLLLCCHTTQALSQNDTIQVDTAYLLLEQARQLMESREFEEAFATLNQAEALRTRDFGSNSYQAAIIRASRGKVYLSLRQFDKAIEIWLSCLDIFKEQLGKKNEEVADTYRSLADAYRSKRDFNKSEEYYLKALAIFETDSTAYCVRLAATYHSYGNQFLGQQQHQKALEQYVKISALARCFVGKDSILLTKSFVNQAGIYNLYAEIPTSIQLLEQAKVIADKYLPPDHPTLTALHAQMAQTYFYKGSYDKAYDYNLKAVQILEKLPENARPNLPNCYNTFGLIYDSQGDYDKAVQYFERSLKLFMDQIGGRNHIQIVRVLANIGRDSRLNEEPAKALQHFEEALEILGLLGQEFPVEEATLYDHLASIYREPPYQDFDKAIQYYEKGLEIRERTQYYPGLLDSYQGLSLLLREQGKLKEALEYGEKGLEISEKIFGSPSNMYARSLISQGMNVETNGDYARANVLYNQAVQALNYQGLDSLRGATSIPFLYNTKGLIAVNLGNQYRSNPKNLPLLQKAKQTMEEAIQILEYQNRQISQSSKTGFEFSADEIYYEAIKINKTFYDLDPRFSYLDSAFAYTERSKSMRLYEAIKASKARNFGNIPNDLLQEEQQYREDITFYEKKRQLYLEQGLPASHPQVAAISEMLFKLKIAYQQLTKKMETEYPRYYRAKYDLSTVSLSYVQDYLLEEDEVLIEYDVASNGTFIFVIQKNKIALVEVEHGPKLAEWVTQMTQGGIYAYYGKAPEKRSPRELDLSIERYTYAAHELYKALILPIEPMLQGHKKLTIVPDGILNYVPFEALLASFPSKMAKFNVYDFLIKQYQIQYSYSATLLDEMSRLGGRKSQQGNVVIFAPFSDTEHQNRTAQIDDDLLLKSSKAGAQLPPLALSKEEANFIRNLMVGKAFIGQEATIENFQAHASNFRILHLTTHAKALDQARDYNYLAFSVPGQPDKFTKLYARELYNFELQAELVFLSGCETALGQLLRGEGLISLARAFAYSGAKSIITSLWMLPEAASKEITESFYTAYSKSNNKSEALTIAKRKYLEANGLRRGLAHPFFWAGFIGIGDLD